MSDQQLAEGWNKIRFGKIATQVSKRFDPQPGDEKKYIGLEHLDHESLVVKRWGGDVVLKGQKLAIKKGDILFAKRNAYLKRVAVAPFDGIFSAHGMVIRPTGDLIVPEFLPFLMQSDQFMNRAIAISEGSLSPTIKWKTLAEQVFFIPPKDIQRKVIELGGHLIEQINDCENAIDSLNVLYRKVSRDFILGGNDFHTLFGSKKTNVPPGWRLGKLEDVLSRVQYGTSDAVHTEGCTPVLRMMNIEGGKITASDLKFSKLPISDLESIKLKRGDILFNRTNSMEWVGKTGLFSLDGDYVFASYMLRLNVKTDLVTPEFVNRYLNIPLIQYRLKAFATPGVSQANINPTSLKSMPFLIPPLEQIIKADEQLTEIEESLSALSESRKECFKLQRVIREKLLGI